MLGGRTLKGKAPMVSVQLGEGVINENPNHRGRVLGGPPTPENWWFIHREKDKDA